MEFLSVTDAARRMGARPYELLSLHGRGHLDPGKYAQVGRTRLIPLADLPLLAAAVPAHTRKRKAVPPCP
jgi:hypothetical protein